MKRLLILCFLLGAIVSVPSASAGPSLAVKSRGLWYWSLDLPNTVYPRYTEDATKFGGMNWRRTVNELGVNLTPDQKRRLSDELNRTSAERSTPEPDFKDGTHVDEWTCRGVGASIASVLVDVDLYHRFSCRMRGESYKRLGQFTAPVDTLRKQIKATPAPVPDALLNRLVAAYRALGVYQHNPDPVARTIPVIVTGRRAVALVGVEPV